MSYYYVSLSGDIKLKNITADEARAIIESVIDPHIYDTAINIKKDEYGHVVVGMWAYIKWDDEIDTMFVKLNPHTIEGEIKCNGEDGGFWKYVFEESGSGNMWMEYEGVKTYQFGYAISKKEEEQNG